MLSKHAFAIYSEVQALPLSEAKALDNVNGYFNAGLRVADIDDVRLSLRRR